jgi:hypothetical protein
MIIYIPVVIMLILLMLHAFMKRFNFGGSIGRRIRVKRYKQWKEKVSFLHNIITDERGFTIFDLDEFNHALSLFNYYKNNEPKIFADDIQIDEREEILTFRQEMGQNE